MSRIGFAATVLGLVLTTGRESLSQAVSPPRAGLSAKQSQDARRITAEALKGIRPKVEVPNAPNPDPREYIVGVELMTSKKSADPKKAVVPSSGPRAVVTAYRYADDTTLMAVVDLESGKVVDMQSVQHIRTSLSDAEYRDAQALAREKSPEVKTLFEKIGADKIDVYPQYSQFTLPGDPRVHRMIQLTYRVNGRDLSAPRPFVDLTSREVRIPNPPAPKD